MCNKVLIKTHLDRKTTPRVFNCLLIKLPLSWPVAVTCGWRRPLLFSSKAFSYCT